MDLFIWNQTRVGLIARLLDETILLLVFILVLFCDVQFHATIWGSFRFCRVFRCVALWSWHLRFGWKVTGVVWIGVGSAWTCWADPFFFLPLSECWFAPRDVIFCGLELHCFLFSSPFHFRTVQRSYQQGFFTECSPFHCIHNFESLVFSYVFMRTYVFLLSFNPKKIPGAFFFVFSRKYYYFHS